MVRTITSERTDARVTIASPRSPLPVGKRRALRRALPAVQPA